jgi:hypothetical protein
MTGASPVLATAGVAPPGRLRPRWGAVLLLTDQGYHVETAPTLRAAFEHGRTLQWLVAYGDEPCGAS